MGAQSNSHDPYSLSVQIERAITDRSEAKRRSINGQKLAKHLFDVERTGVEVASFYAHVVGCSREHQ